MTNPKPFIEAVGLAREALINNPDALLFQKWNCAKCGSEQHIEQPNHFYTSGRCEKCNNITDLRKTGFSFGLLISHDPYSE